jgi:RNA polymerase sigma-70 factor (ECF subfamily)
VEDELIRRAKHGDATAFDNLVEMHRETMFRYAYLIVCDAHLAEDVTQEAVLRAYKYLHRFDATQAFRPWALQIVRNLARNQNRSWGRYKHMLTRMFDGYQRKSNDVEAVTVAQQQAQHLHEAVRQLSADYQEVIYARYFLELSVEECASTLRIAKGTVKSRSHRALKQLKAVIEQHYPHLKQEIPHE